MIKLESFSLNITYLMFYAYLLLLTESTTSQQKQKKIATSIIHSGNNYISQLTLSYFKQQGYYVFFFARNIINSKTKDLASDKHTEKQMPNNSKKSPQMVGHIG